MFRSRKRLITAAAVGFLRGSGPSAATLAADPAGESPAGGNCPVATVVISGDGEGDRTVESPEVKVSVREASNPAGRSEGEPISPEIAQRWECRAVSEPVKASVCREGTYMSSTEASVF